MGTQKLTRKDIKAPDEFQNWMSKVIEFFSLYGRWVLVGVVVIIITIVVGVMIARHADKRALEIAADFDRAVSPVIQVKLRDEQHEDIKPEAIRERFTSALPDLDSFASTNPDTPLSRLALLIKGTAAATSGDYNTAMQAYGAFLTSDPSSPMSFIVWEALGAAADASSRRDEAERAYTEMTKSQSSLIRAWAYLHLGDLYNPAARMRPEEPVDASKAREYYEKGEKEVSGEEIPMAHTLVQKMIQARLFTMR